MKTKYGNATVNGRYYMITSRKEGNHGKTLHQLIWEDFYGCEVPKGYHIHHRDHNPLNNCIMNLQLIRKSEHHKLHNTGKNNPMFGKNHSEETKLKMSKSQNTSGYLNVSKHKDKRLKQGFTWKYQYYVDGKHVAISSVDLDKLEAKVKAKGLVWRKI